MAPSVEPSSAALRSATRSRASARRSSASKASSASETCAPSSSADCPSHSPACSSRLSRPFGQHVAPAPAALPRSSWAFSTAPRNALRVRKARRQLVGAGDPGLEIALPALRRGQRLHELVQGSPGLLPLRNLALKLRQLVPVRLLLVLKTRELRGDFLQAAGRRKLARGGYARVQLRQALTGQLFGETLLRGGQALGQLLPLAGCAPRPPRDRATPCFFRSSSRVRRAAAAFSARACASASPERTSISRSLWMMRIRPVAARLSVRPGAIPWRFSGREVFLREELPGGTAGHRDGYLSRFQPRLQNGHRVRQPRGFRPAPSCPAGGPLFSAACASSTAAFFRRMTRA